MSGLVFRGGSATALVFRGGGALGLDAIQQQVGWFVVRVLRHEIASECFGENALGQTVNTYSGVTDSGFQPFSEREQLVDATDYFSLLLSGGQTKLEISQFFCVDI